VKSFGRLFPVLWLCFTQAFSTLPSKNILRSYVIYTHRCFSPLQLYYPLRLSPSLKTRRRRAAGVGGGRRCFMMFLFHFFLLRHLAYGVMSHYIYMVLFCILNELKHFGICNDLPARVRSQFPTLSRLCLSSSFAGLACVHCIHVQLLCPANCKIHG